MPVITVDAILFDMDGTLIDSTPGVTIAWAQYAKEYGLDAEHVLHATHGVRLVDSLRAWCKLEGEDRVIAEAKRFEDIVIKSGILALPGSLDILAQIADGGSESNPGWAIVTSATAYYTPQVLAAVGISLPKNLVTSGDVSRGKPFPDPYLEGAKRCGFDPANCLVVEDAPSGLRSGKTAGAKTLAVCTSHTRKQIVESGAEPDYIVSDLTQISVKWVDGKIEVTIKDIQ